ncbi:hypothetical protein GCM10022204_43130 [Microlunatus aurantiacus]|uniref:Glycosyltransferase 2-like domain-containing protein n=1 Tax=Microlunatus aurantiacus TaxID=446786 RepID=A0ABP7EI40_9ACTN
MTDPNSHTASEPSIDDLEVVLVSYRSRHHVEELLNGWPPGLAVAVVDNSANSDGLADFVTTRSQVRYLSGNGQGFARGANLGAFTSTKPYVVFVNPDCRPILEQILSLARGVAADENAITHAATPVNHEGGIDLGVGGWEPSIPRSIVHALGIHHVAPSSGLFAHPRVGEHIDVDWVTGTCMAVHLGRFREVGGFDETFFVYCEDTALGHRARQRGWHCVLRDDVLVLHGTGSSGAPSSEMRRLQGASYATYLRRYGKSRLQAVTMANLYVLGCLWRGIALTVTGRRARAAATWSIVRGMVTRRAFVGGIEVAHARAVENGAG